MPTSPPTDRQLVRQHWPRDYLGERQTRLHRNPEQRQAARVRSSGAWRKLREVVLSQQPCCADPHGTHRLSGRVVLAEEVDHIIPLTHRPDLGMDPANLQGLCRACHARKSGTERRMGGRERS